MSKLFDLSGKTAIIIGGNSTLGGAMAVGLAEHGASITIVCRNLEKAEPVEERIQVFGGEVKSFQVDVTSEEALLKVADERRLV